MGSEMCIRDREALIADGLVAKIGVGEPLAIPCEKLEKFDLN